MLVGFFNSIRGVIGYAPDTVFFFIVIQINAVTSSSKKAAHIEIIDVKQGVIENVSETKK